MKKRLFLMLLLTAVMMSVMAVPAKKGQWKTLRLEDGTEVRAMLCGDEHVHFWMTTDGQRFMRQEGEVFRPVSEVEIANRAMARRTTMKSLSNRLRTPRKVSMGDRTHYEGKKKGLVIMAQFTDVKFQTANNLAKYKRIMNEENYSDGSFRGSVADYFKAQSDNQFELEFDVVGPYTLSNNQKYYGQNDYYGNDMHAEEMIKEACEMADAEVDFSDYDWDGDDEVDQVFVLYAGQGEADGGSDNTIWPHMYTLKEGLGEKCTFDGVKVNTYACSNEVDVNNKIEGIGCFCHEFSHCMGFPDFYDTSYSGWFGMGDFDLMCGGSYNGNTFCPAGYTAHEKMMCGWQEPTVLSDKDTVITNMKSMAEHGETFIIYNDAHPDEYYMLENRQKKGWDTSYPASGMMITHVDFDKDIWLTNCPNTKITTSSDYYIYYHYPLNDHERMTIVHADNDDDSKYWDSVNGYYTKETSSTDLYPYKKLDSLTATTKPAATFYNKNSKGTKTVEWAILNIKKNTDGTMGFTYLAKNPNGTSGQGGDGPVKPTGDYLFYESFDQCAGKGGNDGLWSGSIAIAEFVSDNDGWDSEKPYGANDCAKFGTNSVVGEVSTPTFAINGTAKLTFKAGAWNSTKDNTSLKVKATGATISTSEFTIEKGGWTDCEATLTGTGNVKLTFTPGLRFFLDEVLVVDPNASAIQNVQTAASQHRIYTLDGRYVGNDTSVLPRGLYIINGKKVVK